MDVMAYIAKCTCGGIVMACADLPEHKKDCAREVADCIKDGFTISRMTVEEVRTARWCDNRGKCKLDQLALFGKEK